MPIKTQMILVKMLWNSRCFQSKLWHTVCVCLVILFLSGCKQGHEEFKLGDKKQPLVDNRVSPDTLLLSNLPDSLQPKPIFIENIE